MTPDEVARNCAAYARDLREKSEETRRCAIERAEAEHAYLKARAVAYAQSDGKSVAAREKDADAATLDQRRRFTLADGLYKSAIEAERSARGVMSAWQSVVSFAKTERELMGRET